MDVARGCERHVAPPRYAVLMIGSSASRADVTRGHHRTGLEHVRAIGDLEHAAGHLLDDEDGETVVGERADDAEHLLGHDRREAERRLVEQQEAGADARPRPIASICCSPPESSPAGMCRRSARIGNRS